MPKTDVDDAYWTYEYDVRYRLTKAESYNSSDVLLNSYAYTYDKAGNMVTKVVDGSVTTVYAHNTANELTKRTVGGTVTDFKYDLWGKMTSKAQGLSSATYEYRWGGKLSTVTSDFPEEANVKYGYWTDDNKRRNRNPGTNTQHNWDAGWNVVNEEDNCGNLTVTYIHDPGKVVGTILARIEGATPASGTYTYYCQDIIGSTRSVWNADKTEYASYDYTPYGEVYAHSGSDVKHRFTGQEWDDAAELYYFPFRYYSPEIARWISREPSWIDGPNLYWYGLGSPVNGFDLLGLDFYMATHADALGLIGHEPQFVFHRDEFFAGVFQGLCVLGDVVLPGAPYSVFYSECDPGIQASQVFAYIGWYSFQASFVAALGPSYGVSKHAGTLSRFHAWFAKYARPWFRLDRAHHGKPWQFDGKIPSWFREWFGKLFRR